MGPNGSGKSTLSYILAGREGYDVTEGRVLFNGKDLLEMSVEERAWAGVFLAFQYPVEVPGVSNIYFLKAALNGIRKFQGLSELDAMDFIGTVKSTPTERVLQATAVTFEPITMTVRKSSPAMIPS